MTNGPAGGTSPAQASLLGQGGALDLNMGHDPREPDLVSRADGGFMGAWPSIGEGDRDSEESNGVYKVQRLLRHHGSDLAPDHVFGPATATAVRTFQEGNGLDADGIVAEETWLRLIVPVQQGDAGEAVSAAQSQWRFIDHDGDFGPKTDALVRDFQQANGLDVDGIVGPQTWQRMGRGPIIDPPEHLEDKGR